MQIPSELFINKEKQLSFSAIFIAFSLVIYPATVLLIPKINGVIFAFFSLASLFFIFKNRNELIRTSNEELKFYLSIAIFFLVTLFISINAGFSSKITSKYLHILLVIPIYIYLRSAGVRLGYLWYGLVIGAVMSAAIAIYDIRILRLPRAHGFINPILFGDLSLVMGCMSIAGYGWFKQRAKWQMLIPLFALVCGVVASLLSGTRGSLVALPFLMIVFYWYIKPYFSFKHKVVFAMIVGVVFTAIYLIPQASKRYQISSIIEHIQQYSDSDISSNLRSSSPGPRLEMWQASWKMFLDNPILGVGWGHYKEQYKLQADQGLRSQSSAKHSHPHNEYFFALASAGSVGFIVLMMMFLTSAWLFVKYIKQAKTANAKRVALAGLILIVSYMAFCLTEPLLYRTRTVNFFAFYLAVFIAAIYSENKKIEDTG